MLTGLYSAATGLNAAERIHELIAENLAHVSVPGYRGQSLALHTFEEAMQGTLPTPSPEGHGSWPGEMRTDFSTGPIQRTGRNLDVALGGDAFFEINTPDGPRYTRNGVFFVDNDGQIVNTEGYAAAGTNGPLVLPPNTTGEQVAIGTDGTVSAQGQTIGQLRIVRFSDNQQLIRAGTTLFAAPAGMQPEEANVVVMQGARELANVSAVTEMVRLIVATRHYEAAQKALTTLDQALGQRTNPQA
jgi:flagellar basal body rod protein FlgG